MRRTWNLEIFFKKMTTRPDRMACTEWRAKPRDVPLVMPPRQASRESSRSGILSTAERPLHTYVVRKKFDVIRHSDREWEFEVESEKEMTRPTVRKWLTCP